MAIDLTKALTAVSVGVVDEVLERKGGHFSTSSFGSYRDIYRAVAVVGGHAVGMFMPRWATLGENVATAATPLLVKSLASVVMQHGGAPAKSGFVMRDIAGVGPRGRTWVPNTPSGGSYRPFTS